MATVTPRLLGQPVRTSSRVQRDALQLISYGGLFMLLTALALAFIGPFLYALSMSLKSDQQLPLRTFVPQSPVTISYQGQDLPLYKVPVDGTVRELALLSSTRSRSVWVDPTNLEAQPLELQVRAASLEKVLKAELHPETYSIAATNMEFPIALRNTLIMVIVSSLGAVSSGALVAYGFSRFRIPGRNILFAILMATIILPPQVTLIPTFIVFQELGWVGTLLPLIVPHFFANAYNVFLLRQYFMGIPNEMDEAAKVDGANPIQTFLRVVLPQARPALIAVTLFHALYMWNEFYNANIYTTGSAESQPLSVVLGRFQQQYSSQPNQMMAGAVLTMLAPLVLFFLAQRTFMQGVVITGVEK